MATTISLNYTGGMIDYTAYLLWGTLTVKLNTADFAFSNLPTPYSNGTSFNDVVITDPPWTGKIMGTVQSDFADLNTGRYIHSMTATNSTAIVVGTSPFDISYLAQNATTNFELEDGSGHIMLESGTPWGTAILLTEGALSYSYSHLSFSYQTNTDSTVSELGQCIIYQPGLWPGHTFALTSPTLPTVNGQYTVTQVTVYWPGLAANPFFRIEFGASQLDTGKTLTHWIGR